MSVNKDTSWLDIEKLIVWSATSILCGASGPQLVEVCGTIFLILISGLSDSVF